MEVLKDHKNNKGEVFYVDNSKYLLFFSPEKIKFHMRSFFQYWIGDQPVIVFSNRSKNTYKIRS